MEPPRRAQGQAAGVGGFRRQVVTVLLTTFMIGLSWVKMEATPEDDIQMAMGSLFVGSAMNSVMVGSVHELWQSVISPDMQGRLFAIAITFVSGASSIGLPIGGPNVDQIGLRFWFLMGGIIMVFGIVPFLFQFS